MEITVEVQGNYPNFKQNLAEWKILVIWKVSQSPTLFGKWRLRGVSFQTLTTRGLSKEYDSRNWNSSRKVAFSRKAFSKNSTKRNFGQPKVYKNTEQILMVFWKPHTRGVFPGDESRGIFSQGQILLKKCSTFRSTLVGPPIYDREYPEKL